MSGRSYLNNFRTNLKMQNDLRNGGKSQEQNPKLTCQELITMNVQEKEEYFKKHKLHLRRTMAKSGISQTVRDNLQKRGMVPGDLKFLPACEVRDILFHQLAASQVKPKQMGSPKSDTYSEEGVNQQIPDTTLDKVRSNTDVVSPAEGGFIAEFANLTLIEHKKLLKDFKTEKLNTKIEEQGSMYGKASMQISDALAEQRANPEISKVESMFDELKISVHYQKFQEMAMQILET